MSSRPDDAADPRVDGAPDTSTDAPVVGASAHEASGAAAADASASASEAAASDGRTDAAVAADAQQPPLDERPAPQPVTIERDDVQVQARLVPRYGRFMILGAIVGVVGGWLWSRLGSSGPLLGVGPVIDTSAMVPFLIAVGALAGLVLGAVLAIVLDRLVGRRKRTLTAERTRHHRGDLDA